MCKGTGKGMFHDMREGPPLGSGEAPSLQRSGEQACPEENLQRAEFC